MPFDLKDVVPWGRTFEEYREMFSLTNRDLDLHILGCGDGPAGFNASMNQLGKKCISLDPLYRFPKNKIQKRIDESFDEVLGQVRKNKDEFVWDSIRTVEELGNNRKKAMKQFIADYETGKTEGRYISGELPQLDFTDNQFDIALCSHFLFLYSKQFSLEFHIDSILELCRVAREVRIFPLLEFGSTQSRHLDKTYKTLTDHGHKTAIKTVDYEFQRGGNQLLEITSQNGQQ